MNKKPFIILSLLFFAALPAIAQPPGGGRGFQRRTVEERVKIVHQALDSVFVKEISAAKFTEIDAVFTDYYKAMDKSREELMAGGGPPDEATREAMRTKMQELGVERDEKLQKLFTEAQYKKWKDEIEPSLRPRRGPGGPGGGGGGGGR
ncbi:MAG: hypothetical protein JNM68_03230 [Dinghuibacter sp.]|nr:hypothetical protein [Dinghuibacter sp.]